MNSIKKLEGKWIRWWHETSPNSNCVYAKILGYDEVGVLFSGEDGGLEGAEWWRWAAVNSISYFSADGPKIESDIRNYKTKGRTNDRAKRSNQSGKEVSTPV